MSEHITDDGQTFGLGCNLPESFPTGFATGADSFPVMTLDGIRGKLTAGKTLYDRRNLFGGKFITNQRSTNACNGHATAGALSESLYVKGAADVRLSGADSYSQMNQGRDQGSTLADGLKVVVNGIATEASVPWNMIYTNQIPASAKAERARFRGLDPIAVDTEEELATGILLGFIGVIAVHVQNGYDRTDGNGICLGGNGPGNHAVRLNDVGMLADGTLFYSSPGSWDTTWGDGGWTRFTWSRQLRESVKYHRFWLLQSAADDPNAVNPPTITG